MALFVLDQELRFPPPHLAEPDGLLAMGGDLSPERLLLAYRNGIFPWYDEDPILWWSPDPRFTLIPSSLKISKSVRSLLNRNYFDFTVNTAFPEVIAQCKKITRPGQDGTWITHEVEQAYTRLHQLGFAHSAEVWRDGRLAGGLYGIRMGKVFFGESMFSLESNASRYAFISYVRQLQQEGVELIDCQVHTDYLESMGAQMMPGREFRELLDRLIAPSAGNPR
ncbi:MAG: leucyl/phenylalanyl-tRNA--protein transferase [Chitinophagaceae bacterium]|nr:MAG: leucyl/phenylalanyl-tRNA--protein transferase [Chitinophagaceae bacterium]